MYANLDASTHGHLNYGDASASDDDDDDDDDDVVDDNATTTTRTMLLLLLMTEVAYMKSFNPFLQ